MSLRSERGWRLRLLFIGLAGVLLIMMMPSDAYAQVSDEVREAAMRDFHGDDMDGRDGPAAKAGLDLLLLYHAHQSSEASAEESVVDRVPGIPTEDGRVTVDVIAVERGEALVEDIAALGGQKVQTSGRMVSAQIPISAIREVAMLDGVQQVRPAQATTRDTPSDPRNTLENAIAERGTTAVMSDSGEESPPSPSGPDSVSSENTTLPDAATDTGIEADVEADIAADSTTQSTSDASENRSDPTDTGSAHPNPDVQQSTEAESGPSSSKSGSGAIGFIFLVIFILVLADARL